MMSESRTDILIHRIASQEESRGEFAEFEAAAGGDPRAWERLARTLRDELHMRAALGEALGGDRYPEIDRSQDARYAESGLRLHRFQGWSGWAAAALVAIAWLWMFTMPRTGETPVPPAQTHFVSLTADEALDHYLRAGESEGRIVAELPALLVESYANELGGLDVYYVRRFLERDSVAQVYELAEDEHGGYVPVPVHPASVFSTPTSM